MKDTQQELFDYVRERFTDFALDLKQEIGAKTDIPEIVVIYGLIEAAFGLSADDASTVANEVEFKYLPESEKQIVIAQCESINPETIKH